MATVPMTDEQQDSANLGGKTTSAIDPYDPNLTLEQLQASYAAQLKADEEAFAKTRAEIEQMAA